MISDYELHQAQAETIRALQGDVETWRNRARHWEEQEAKQRRLRAEEGRWKHRALAAELDAIHARDEAARLRGLLWDGSVD